MVSGVRLEYDNMVRLSYLHTEFEHRLFSSSNTIKSLNCSAEIQRNYLKFSQK